jgi:adenylate cyclase
MSRERIRRLAARLSRRLPGALNLAPPAMAGLGGACAVAAVLLALRWSGILQPLELAGYDRFVALRGSSGGGGAATDAVQSRVVQVAVGEADIARFGWPLSDRLLADAVRRIHAAAPRAIGVDIFRPTPVPPGSDDLAAAIRDAPELIWADRFGEATWAGIEAPEAAAGRSGFTDVVPDPGEIARRGLLYLDDGRQISMALPLRLAILYLNPERIAPRADAAGNLRLGHVSLPPLDRALGGYRGIDTRGYQILREYERPPRLRSIPFGALLDGLVPPAEMSGRIVVVGVIADSVKDYVAAPISLSGPVAIPGATLHGLFAAQLLAHALDGLPATHPLSRLAEAALLLAAMLGGGIAGTFVGRIEWLVLALVGGAAALLAGSYVAFRYGLWLPIVLLPLGWVAAALVARAMASQVEHAERVFLMRLFSTHISAPIAQEMWRRRHDFVAFGRPKPVRLTATVLFSDVNDFTTATEDMEPEAIVRWLEPYMQAVTQLVDDYGGVVERFSGDGVLAMFGVPLPRETPAEIAADALAAVRCAIRMGEALAVLNAGYRAAGQPEIRVGIGIHSGELVGCSLGSLERQQYTTMGDTTNTAARLVNVAKDVMKAPGADEVVRIVVGRMTAEMVAPHFELHPLGAVELKGKARRTQCFAVGPAPTLSAAAPAPPAAPVRQTGDAAAIG